MNRDSTKIGEELAEYAAHIDAAKHGFLTKLRAFNASGEWGYQGARTCSQWMSWRLGLDIRTSREYIQTADALEKLPAIDDAFRRGEVSYSKVRVGLPRFRGHRSYAAIPC